MNQNLKNIIQITIFVVIFGGTFILYQNGTISKLLTKRDGLEINTQETVDKLQNTTTTPSTSIEQVAARTDEGTEGSTTPQIISDAKETQTNSKTENITADSTSNLDIKFDETRKIITLWGQSISTGKPELLTNYVSTRSIDALSKLINNSKTATKFPKIEEFKLSKIVYLKTSNKIYAKLANHSTYPFIKENGSWKLDLIDINLVETTPLEAVHVRALLLTESGEFGINLTTQNGVNGENFYEGSNISILATVDSKYIDGFKKGMYKLYALLNPIQNVQIGSGETIQLSGGNTVTTLPGIDQAQEVTYTVTDNSNLKISIPISRYIFKNTESISVNYALVVQVYEKTSSLTGIPTTSGVTLTDITINKISNKLGKDASTYDTQTADVYLIPKSRLDLYGERYFIEFNSIDNKGVAHFTKIFDNNTVGTEFTVSKGGNSKFSVTGDRYTMSGNISYNEQTSAGTSKFRVSLDQLVPAEN